MQPMLAIAPHTTARTVTQEISRYVILAMIVGPASMAYGVHWEYQRAQSKRHHYVDVLIQARQDDRNFLLKPIGMEPWPATSCTPLDWKPGQRMKWIDYQQRDGCKDFKENGSYVCYFDDLGKCIIFQEELAHVEYISQ